MRNIWSMLFAFGLSGIAQATPSPLPPDSFKGEQYIDGRGCVFNRQGHGWMPRLDNQGKAICGFPSSLSVRRTDPDAVSVLAPANPPAAPDPEQLLREQLVGELRQGEFTADPRELELRRPPENKPGDGGLGAEIQSMLRQQEAIRATMAGISPGSDLCARLGYVPDPDSRPSLGGDVTQGLCPGMHAAAPRTRVVTGPMQSKDEPTTPTPQHERPTVISSNGDHAETPAESSHAPSLTDKLKRPIPRPVKMAVPAAGTRPPAMKRAINTPPKPRPELIPASARYVQLGSFPDDEKAGAALRNLAVMGFPLLRGQERGKEREMPLILAGPFDDRRALVAALTMIRDSGYTKAVAR